jgi:hypothetical protein
MEVNDERKGMLIRPIPRMEDLFGVDAGKYTYKEMVEKLDRFRSRSRCTTSTTTLKKISMERFLRNRLFEDAGKK